MGRMQIAPDHSARCTLWAHGPTSRFLRSGSADRFQAEYLDTADKDVDKSPGKGVTLEALGGRLVSVESMSTYERVIKA